MDNSGYTQDLNNIHCADFLLLLEHNCLVPTYVVQVAYGNGREGDIFDGEICAFQHSHGGTGLVSVPDV